MEISNAYSTILFNILVIFENFFSFPFYFEAYFVRTGSKLKTFP